MNADQLAVAKRVIHEVVQSHHRRVRHWYDERDLTQRAWVVVLESYPDWDEARGPLAPYLATALHRQLGNELLHDYAPVSASRGRLNELYGLRGASIDGVPQASDGKRTPESQDTVLADADPATVQPPRWADQVLADAQWAERVTCRLARVVGADGLDGLVDMLREGPNPPASGRPPDNLGRSRAVAYGRIVHDPKLREMLRERS